MTLKVSTAANSSKHLGFLVIILIKLLIKLLINLLIKL